jgi:hypothetical protein
MNVSTLFWLLFLWQFNITYGFIFNYKDLIFYNISKYNVTELNCNNILDRAKIYNLFCINETETKMISQMIIGKKPKSYYQKYLETFYYQNKEELGNMFDNFILSYNLFSELSNTYLIQAFGSWIFDTKKFIANNKQVIDNFLLSIINDIFTKLEEPLEKFPDSQNVNVFGKVHLLSRYSTYESNKCIEKYSDIKNLKCIILSKNYYIVHYNNMMNQLLN